MPKERKQIKDCYKWRLEDIFATDQNWEEEFKQVQAKLADFPKYSGKLTDDKTILECLEAQSDAEYHITRLYVYAYMRYFQDTRVALYQGLSNRAESLAVQAATISSFVTPELSALSDEKLKQLEEDPKFVNFSVVFKNILKNKALILSKEEEKLISEFGLIAETPHTVYTMFNNADVKFKPVVVNGKEVELSYGTYGPLIEGPDREVRKAAFESMFNAFKDHINFISANYDGNCKKDWVYAKIRKFNSSLDAALYSEDVPAIVYENLINAVTKGTKTLHKYMQYRAKELGLDDYNMWDMYVPLIPSLDVKYSYEKASAIVKDAIKVMGKEYSDIFNSAFTSGWIDVFENKGKRSGAYSWGCYGVHPYVHLNHDGTIGDMFTIAHEMGHAMHTYYSNATQCKEKASYKIFVAEIASTVNEVILLKYLLKSAKGEMRKYLLNYYLNMFKSTIFRQTQFAEFEEIAHKAVEQGMPLTADYLCTEYEKLNRKYYGPALKKNDLVKYEWSRIPHFYTSFYVYKYATGLTSAITIANNILKYGEKYFAKYKQFLSAGSSLPPLDILKLADVDLTSEEPFKRAMKEFTDTFNELVKSE